MMTFSLSKGILSVLPLLTQYSKYVGELSCCLRQTPHKERMDDQSVFRDVWVDGTRVMEKHTPEENKR